MFLFKNKKAFTIIEMLIYVAILAAFSLFIFELVVVMSNSYKRIAASRIVADSAATSMERMTREIRGANDIDSGQSVLNNNVGRLRLFSTDEDGNATTVTFALESGRVNVYENDVLVGPLTSANASTTSLVFNVFSTAAGRLVGVNMNIEASIGSETRNDDFESATLIRNSK